MAGTPPWRFSASKADRRQADKVEAATGWRGAGGTGMGPGEGSGVRGCEAALILPERPHACATCREGPDLHFNSISCALGDYGTNTHPAQAEWTEATRAGS